MTGDLLDNLAFVDDIEDIIGENDVKPKDRYKNKPVPVPKSRKVKKKNLVNNEAPIQREKEEKESGVTASEEGNFQVMMMMMMIMMKMMMMMMITTLLSRELRSG